MSEAVEKRLTANDIGATGAHQAGILVPKKQDILKFFPALERKMKNPRAILKVIDDAGHEWSFTFIYYNNKFFGGTRNEYRLTGMTAFFRRFNLKAGDTVVFQRAPSGNAKISFLRSRPKSKVLKLSSTWRVIDM